MCFLAKVTLPGDAYALMPWDPERISPTAPGTLRELACGLSWDPARASPSGLAIRQERVCCPPSDPGPAPPYGQVRSLHPQKLVAEDKTLF